MFDDNHDEYHYQKALKLERETEAADLFDQMMLNSGMTKVNKAEVEELDLNNLIYEDSVEELNVFVDQVLESAARDNQVLESAARDTVSPGGWTPAGSRPVVSTEPAAPAVPWSDIVSPGGWNPAGSVVSTEPAAPAAPWGLNALGEPAACPQYFCASTGEPLSPGDVGPKPAVDGEEPESRLCTGCGSIDHFFQTPPFKCLCGSLNSQPATDDWFGIALDPKPPMNNANAA